MFKTNYILNPKRAQFESRRERFSYRVKLPFVLLGLWLGFPNIQYSYVHGNKQRLRLGFGCSTMNTVFNVISGDICVGDGTIFGHNCMVLTGTHRFINGRRASLGDSNEEETPTAGRDIQIGTGCFIGSGTIIQGNVKIGDNVLIGSGAVVTGDLPGNCFAAGVPAKVISFF